ncbi:hypothetical protein [Fundidesulfovibrio terrae]|uniref:hypothetical protein n=1 Tax=Fundidesulfovibrio terrae TaxID=2922866 RepID=UPI001FAEDFC4|nr:hypothetical protein [Fundidesulfovibrio terrae]
MIQAFVIFAVLLAACPVSGADLTSRADRLLGIAYRPDGVLDESGRWTLFEHPEQSFDTPGLNCSGLDYALMRLLAPGTVTTRQAARDRQGDSGPGAPMGQDWDFGFDLILNLSEGMTRTWLLPEPRPATGRESGRDMLGFATSDQGAWKKALAQVRPDQAVLVSFSQTGRRMGYTLQHYHVGVILPDASGGRWLYQATPKSGAHKVNLADPSGMARFLSFFSGGDKRALLLAVTLPPGR